MAIGFSGSNGGVKGEYRKFSLEDVSTTIEKYESLYKNIPADQEKNRDLYRHAISGLEELKEKMM